MVTPSQITFQVDKAFDAVQDLLTPVTLHQKAVTGWDWQTNSPEESTSPPASVGALLYQVRREDSTIEQRALIKKGSFDGSMYSYLEPPSGGKLYIAEVLDHVYVVELTLEETQDDS
jgi:hypothetical protein